MTFRTNQPRSALASLSAFWEQSMQNRSSNGWILEEFHFERHDSFYFFAGIDFVSPPLSIDTLDADSSGGPGFCLYQAAAAPTSTATAWRSSSLIRTTTNPNSLRIDI